MFPVKSLQKANEPVPREICAFIFLAGRVVVYETPCDLWVDGIVVKAALEYSILERYTHYGSVMLTICLHAI